MYICIYYILDVTQCIGHVNLKLVAFLIFEQRNTFQVVFATNYTWSFAFFNYADSGIRWGSFRRSGTTYYAVAGYDGGDNIHYHNMNGSLKSSISRIDDRSNVGVRGKYAFHVDNNVDSESSEE